MVSVNNVVEAVVIAMTPCEEIDIQNKYMYNIMKNVFLLQKLQYYYYYNYIHASVYVDILLTWMSYMYVVADVEADNMFNNYPVVIQVVRLLSRKYISV